EDVEQLAYLIATSFGDEEGAVRSWVARAMNLENHRFFVASRNGEPLGAIRTNYYGSDIYITAFGVLPEHRGRGYGRQILRQTVDLLVGERWPRILIEVDADNRNALGLYLSCGF